MIFSHKVVDMPPTRFRYVMGAAFFLPMLTPIILTFAPQVRTDTVIQIIFISAIVCAGAIVLLHRKQTIQWLILFVMLTSVIATLNILVNIYNPDRYISQRVYEKTMNIVQVINQRYDDFSLDTFRIWFDTRDPNNPIFLAVSSIYLLGWGRHTYFQQSLRDDFFTASNIIILSSYDANTTLLQLNEVIQIPLHLRVEDETKVDDIYLISINPNLFDNDLFSYSSLAQYAAFVLEESGWNGYENATSNPFRWTAEPLARLVLDSTDANFMPQKTYQVTIQVVASLEEEVLNSLKLTINNQPIDLIQSGNVFSGTIDGMFLDANTLELIFETARISNPFDLGIQDGRKLGVAVGELTIAPLSDDE